MATTNALVSGGFVSVCGAGLALAVVNFLGWQSGLGVALFLSAVVGSLGGLLILGLATTSPSLADHRAEALAGFPEQAEVFQFTAHCEQMARAIHDLTEQLNSSLSHLADGVSQSMTLIETVSTLCDRAAQDADAATEADGLVRQQASQGQTSLLDMARGMDRLHAFVESNGRKIRRHSDRSAEISAIVETIEEISQRTDILAMNATIESVRAGEHGRGFSRVAEEIRKLAERSADATREIGSLAEVIQAETLESMRGLEEQQNEVDLQVRRVHEVGSSLTRIGEASSRCGQYLTSILSDTIEQSQVAEGLGQFADRATSISQKTLKDSKRLREQAANLRRLYERFLQSVPFDLLEQRPEASVSPR